MCYEDVAVKEQVLSADARKAPNLISQKIAIKKETVVIRIQKLVFKIVK